MDLKTILSETDSWPVEDRLRLMRDLWDRLVDQGYEPELTEEQKAELDRLFGVALARYSKLLEKYPEFEYADLARQAMAAAYARTGRYPEAIELLNKIPEQNRTGELANVPYLLADCLIRTFPPETDDALNANRLINAAEQAAKLLEGFATAQPKSPLAPDALLKLGHCYGRTGVLLADPAERQKVLAQAKAAYDKWVADGRPAAVPPGKPAPPPGARGHSAQGLRPAPTAA